MKQQLSLPGCNLPAMSEARAFWNAVYGTGSCTLSPRDRSASCCKRANRDPREHYFLGITIVILLLRDWDRGNALARCRLLQVSHQAQLYGPNKTRCCGCSHRQIF